MDRIGKKSYATEFRHRINIERVRYVPNGVGGYTEVWETYKENLSATIYPLREEQIYQYRSINTETSHTVKMRGYHGITDKDRIYWNGRYFEILTIANLQERDFVTVILCNEIIVSGDMSQTTTTTTTVAP